MECVAYFLEQVPVSELREVLFLFIAELVVKVSFTGR